MPINGLTGSVRTLRTAKLKLGYVKLGKIAPSDHDQFVGRVDDGVTPEMIAAYEATPIPKTRDSGLYNFGRELRGMLAFEFDATHEGREVALELLNRSWATSRIRCSGTGGDEDHPGEAFVRHEQYRAVLGRAGLLLGERRGGAVAVCKGRDCPLWYDEALKEDKLRGCHREMRLHFILLHPTRDQEHPSYMQQLGWIEVASGSWNGAIDVQSGFAAIRALSGGRTALIPFRLRRVMRSVSAPNGRVNKATLIVDHYADEVLTYAMGPPGRAILRPALRRQLAELAAAEASVVGLAPATFASVADIQPQPDRRALPGGRGMAVVVDRDDAVEEALRTAATDTEDPEADIDEPVRKLTQPDVDELKVACGGAPGQPETLTRYRELVEASYRACGTKANGEWAPYVPLPGAPIGQASFLTTRHRAWIEERLRGEREPAAEPSVVVDGELIDPDDAGRA